MSDAKVKQVVLLPEKSTCDAVNQMSDAKAAVLHLPNLPTDNLFAKLIVGRWAQCNCIVMKP